MSIVVLNNLHGYYYKTTLFFIVLAVEHQFCFKFLKENNE